MKKSLIYITVAFCICLGGLLCMPPSFRAVEPKEYTYEGRACYIQTILVRHFPQNADGMIKMALDYYKRHGKSLEEVKRDTIDSYSLSFYMNNYITRNMFLKGVKYRDPDYIVNFIATVDIWQDHHQPGKWRASVRCADPPYFDGNGEIHYDLIDERDPQWQEKKGEEQWVRYFYDIQKKKTP